MLLGNIGEFGMIERIKDKCIVQPQNVICGIGDDAAVLPLKQNCNMLVSTDMLTEGIHFDLKLITPFQLGWKAAAVNISDIAAMGGRTENLLVSLAMPVDITVEFVDEFYHGMKAITGKYGINIVGGDTVASQNGLAVSVTALGSAEKDKIKYRTGAAIGDLIGVTGTLGDSAAGLAMLQNGGYVGISFVDALLKAHLTPEPQVDMGLLLKDYVSSMEDISDGIASEASEMTADKKYGFLIEEERLPFSAEAVQAAGWLNKKLTELALYGGEDYQLLFTIAPDRYDELVKESSAENITIIGRVVEKEGQSAVKMIKKTGKIVELRPKGYNHFR